MWKIVKLCRFLMDYVERNFEICYVDFRVFYVEI